MAKPEAVDAFMAAAQGHVPLSTNAGSVHTWFPTEPPRPDRSYDTLWKMSGFGIGSAFGLTDFYLRSPLTGLLKLGIAITVLLSTTGAGAVSLSGLLPLLLWGFWEFLHIWTEKDRVVNYGLSAPFDAWHGIGQGMVTDKTTNYQQKTDFTTWQLLSLIGPFGIDAFMAGKPALGFRKLMDTLLFIAFASGAWGAWNDGGSRSGIITLLFLASLIGVFVITPWLTGLTSLVSSPSTVFKSDGKSRFSSLINYFTSSLEEQFGKNTSTEVMRDFGIHLESGSELRDKFVIEWKDPAQKKEEAKKQPPPEVTAWQMSFALGNMITGTIVWIMSFFPLPFMTFTNATELKYRNIKEQRGETPYPFEPKLPGGLGSMASTVTSAIPGAGSILAAAASGTPPSLGDLATAGGLRVPADPLTAARTAAVEHLAGGLPTHRGGARKAPKTESEGLSTEAIALGATVAALIAGGAIKLAADSLTAQ